MSQKSYSKMLASTIQFTTNPPTPTPHHQQAAEAQARQPGRTAPEPRQHATPTHAHQHAPGAPTTTDHHDHNSRSSPPQAGVFPTPHNTTTNQPHTHSARPTSRSLRARHPLQAGPDHTGPDKTNNQKRERRQTAPHKPILRKEVIQPHLPVRLPCYDFVPITSPTFDRSP